MFGFFDKLLGKPASRPGLGLALYGPRADGVDLLKGLDWMIAWAERLGLPPAEWISINYGGPGNRQYKSYKLNAWTKRGRPLPDSACTSVEVGRFREGSKGGMTDDIWYACLITETHPELVIVLDLNTAAPSVETLSKLILDSQTQASFEYGYVVRMPMERSISTYINGRVYGNPTSGLTRAQEDEINKWGNARAVCSSWLDDEISHYLRDIYPLNFLNPHHLAMQVKGQPLKDWIESDPKRGSLKPLIEGKLWTWAVPENRIQALRKVLGPERLLISWGDFDTPSGGPLGHTYGAKPGTVPVFNGQSLTKDDERWITDGLAKMKPIFTRYTGESPEHFDRLIARRQPLFGKLLDLTFTAWSEDAHPDRPAPDEALHAFAAALGEHLVKHYRMGWYVLEDEHGRSLGVCHRGKGGAQTWSYPVDAIAKRIDRGETGFIAGIVAAVGEQIKQP
jgi:hypothetical protein